MEYPAWLPTAEEVAEGLARVLSDDELKLGNVLIQEAYLRLRAKVPNLEQIAADPARVEVARLVLASAVRRVLRNPAALNGYLSESEGGYSYSLQSSLSASATLWFPDEDLAMLVARPAVRRGVINMSRPRRDWA